MEIADVPRCAKSVTIHAKSVTIQDYSLGALRSRQDWQRSIEQVAAMRTMVLSLKLKHCGWWKQTIKLKGSEASGLARQERYNSRQRASELAARLRPRSDRSSSIE